MIKATSMILFAATLSMSSLVVAQTQPDLATLRQRLIETTGQAYVEARDQVLAMPVDQRDTLIADMRSSASSLRERVAGLFLQTRAQHPQPASDFDAKIAEGVTNAPRNRKGGREYRFSVGYEEHNNHPLVFEAIIKLDLPGGKVGLLSRFNHPWPVNPLNIEPLLLILESNDPPGLRGLTAFVIGQFAARYPDPRVAPALKAAYIAERTADPLAMIDKADDLALGLRYVGTADAHQAILELIQFEQGFMAQHGFAPWNDPDAVANSKAAAAEAGRIRARASREKRELTPEELVQLEERERLSQQMLARLLWESLMSARDKLQTLNPPSEP